MQSAAAPSIEDRDAAATLVGARRAIRARGVETVDRALRVVVSILEQGGEASLRLADVSKRSGVSIGSLYHHFGSREGMIHAARARQFLQSMPRDGEAILQILETASTPEEFVAQVEAIVRATQAPERMGSRMRRVELIGAAASRPDLFESLRDIQTTILDLGETVGEAFQARGWLQDGIDPRSMSLFIQAVTFGRVLGDLDRRPVEFDAWVHLLMRALQGVLRMDLQSPIAE